MIEEFLLLFCSSALKHNILKTTQLDSNQYCIIVSIYIQMYWYIYNLFYLHTSVKNLSENLQFI